MLYDRNNTGNPLNQRRLSNNPKRMEILSRLVREGAITLEEAFLLSEMESYPVVINSPVRDNYPPKDFPWVQPNKVWYGAINSTGTNAIINTTTTLKEEKVNPWLYTNNL